MIYKEGNIGMSWNSLTADHSRSAELQGESAWTIFLRPQRIGVRFGKKGQEGGITQLVGEHEEKIFESTEQEVEWCFCF